MLYTYFAGKDFLWEKKTMSSSYFFFFRYDALLSIKIFQRT